VVDYFCKPKLAYYLAKQAYSPVNMNLKYQKFYAENNSDFLADVYLTSDYQGDFHCYISVFGDEDKILEEEYKCRINEKGKSVLLKNLNVMVKDFDVLNFTMRVTFNGNESVSEVCIPVMRDGVCNREPIIDYCKRRMQ
jgi:hypothetical protein